MKKIVVVDADTLIYSAAAVAEKRSVVVKHVKSGRTKEYPTRTAFKDDMEAKKFRYEDSDFEFQDVQSPEPLANCLHTIKCGVNNLKARFPEYEFIFCAGDSHNNFRLNLELPTRYKSNRDKTIRPVHLKDASEYFIKKYNAHVADGCECDDLVSIFAYEYLAKGYEVVVSSPDKDCRSFDGVWLHDYTKPEQEPLLIDEFGELHLNEKNEVKGTGLLWLCMQWLNGDVADCFKPSELTGKKYGEKSAYKVLKGCKTPQEALQVVVQQYKKWYPTSIDYRDWSCKSCTKDWRLMMQMYYQCARMKRSNDDYLDMFELFDKYGVNL